MSHLDIIRGDREGPGQGRGWLRGKQSGPQEGPDPVVCPRLVGAPPLLTGAPWCQGHYQNQAPDGHSGPG